MPTMQSTPIYPEKDAIVVPVTINIGTVLIADISLLFLFLSQTVNLFDEEKILDIRIADAAQLLYKDYAENKELTAFTSLDSEDFYEEG
ncbi:MAG: hypothetical protein ACLQGU_08280 [bacterium]